MKQNYPGFLRVYMPVALGRFPHEFVDLSGHLDPGVPASGNHKGEQLLFLFWVRFHVGGFQNADHVVAQAESVAQGLEGEGVLRHSGEPGQVRAATHGDQQIVVGNVVIVALVAQIFDSNTAALSVHSLDLSLVKVGVGQKAPDGVDDVSRLNAAGNYFGKHRLGEEEVVLTHQVQLDLATARRPL